MEPLAGAVLLPTKGHLEIEGRRTLLATVPGILLAFSGPGLECLLPVMYWAAPLDKETPHLELC